MSTKKALKKIKGHIEDQEYETAVYEATNLLKQLKDEGSDMVQALLFRGLALTFLERKEEAEKCYLHAYRIQPSSPLAVHALRKLYEKDENWASLGRLLEVLVQQSYDAGDAERCAGSLQELLELRSKYGPPERLYLTLNLLLPSSPLIPLFRSLPAPAGSYTPFPSPTYPPPTSATPPVLPSPLPHALHLIGSLDLLLHLLIRSELLVKQKIEAEVKVRRTRLGAGTEKEVRRNVEAEVLGGQDGAEMVELLREVGSHPAVEEEIRREVEIREFGYWKKLSGSLGSAEGTSTKTSISTAAAPSASKSDLPEPDLFQSAEKAKPTKEEAVSRADSLARGFILLDVGGAAEEAWTWVIEGQDEPTIFYDIELLHKFAQRFPTSHLTDFIDDYCRYFRLPLPEPDEESNSTSAAGEEGGAKKKEEKPSRWKKRKGPNARERRKAKRLAVKEGQLAEDVDQEERDELVASMTKLVSQLGQSIFVHRVLTRISIDEEDWPDAIAFAEKGRTLLKAMIGVRGAKYPLAQASLDTALGVALVPYFSPKHHPRAQRLLDGALKEDEKNFEARYGLGQIQQAAGHWADARTHFQTLLDGGAGSERDVINAKEEVGWCLVNEGQLNGGRDVLEGVVEMRDTEREQHGKEDSKRDYARARAWWRLGRTEWMIGDDEARQHAEEWFMASIRALPTFAPAYSALGLCYASATPPDEDRALKCYQKAFELDATEAEAARHLAIGCANEDEWAQVRVIAMRVMQGEGGVEGVAGGDVVNTKGRFAPKNGWAWKALGSTEMHYKAYAKAASAYQIALRAEPDDVSMWTLLGEAYLRAGRHMAALKALQHACTLDAEAWMAQYLIAGTRVQLGEFSAAIEVYEQVEVLVPADELGVRGHLAEAQLSLGRTSAADGFRERARRAFCAALDGGRKVLERGQGHKAWGWKLLGDSLFELNRLEADIGDVEASQSHVRPVLELLSDVDTDRRSQVEGLGHASTLLQADIQEEDTSKAAVFAYAYRAYLLKNEPRVSMQALYDLATALHALAQASKHERPQQQAATKAAISAIRLALEQNGGDERLWNALAVICRDAGNNGSQAAAQHAYVIALELYQKDPIVWTNLGYLYLDLDDRELANQCFLKAQIADPDYAKAWFGQGLLADREGNKLQAKSLFAHSVTLSASSLLEADLALAVATFEPFLQAGNVDVSTLYQPAFALRRYCHQRPSDAAAAHLYALISERLGMPVEAAASLERAVKLLEDEFERTESAEVETRYAYALANLGRVQLATGEYDKADDTFVSCIELITGKQDQATVRIRAQCKMGQGIARSWLDRESLDAFREALEEASTLGEPGQRLKEDIAVTLARTLWNKGDAARDIAKSTLLDCLEHAQPAVHTIVALACVALVSRDADLVEAALSELQTLSVDRRSVENPDNLVETVLYASDMFDRQPDAALTVLEIALQQTPTSQTLRNKLAKHLIQSEHVDQAIELLHGCKDALALELSGMATLLHSEAGGTTVAALSEVMKSVRSRPWEDESWAGLAFARELAAVLT